MKVLVISLAGIGDTLFATPLIHELRANLPEAQIDAFVFWRGAGDILGGNPHLNTVHQKDLVQAGTFASLKYLRELARQRYDVSINTFPQSRIHYRVVARVVNAPLRLSHRYECWGPMDRFLVNGTIPQSYDKHAIENNLALLPLAGLKPVLPKHEYELFLGSAESQWTDEFVASNGLKQRLCLGIHVGSGGTKNLLLRRWPVGHYIALIQRLTTAWPDLAVLLFGGPEEKKAHAEILPKVNRQSVFEVRSNNMRQSAALLKKCAVFLSVDTALMHLAAAMKVPRQIVIETPTWNKPIEPRGGQFVLVRNLAVAGRHLNFYRYDGRDIQGTDAEITKLMESVTVDEVFRVVGEQLKLAGA